MRAIFQPGDVKQFTRHVRAEDCAAFDSGQVHPVYATFALGRDAEWCCRLFVLEMKTEEEEGIGTKLTVEHLSPALQGSVVLFTATITALQGNEITCSYEAHCDNRLVARGVQVQKILPKAKLERRFASL
ncbi:MULTISPECIES: thioesterase family protein [Chitinophaga]|uniref:Fluoroacetyl-CoA-specific thioesterase-like domain-containing protein n=1 Tax=Chitinophaga flava TaxID=2259036 RepID=A0A365Y353_9BACT|nr:MULTISPECIES: hypothetical protein [Chitinophaga]RBL92325.1 hypothetical protein DF182_06975 [Chitinophaga flava]